MDNKLSELSNNARKAVNSFYNWSQLASCTSERVSCLTVEQLKETSELLSALLAENERVASDLVARNGEIEGLKKRADELLAELEDERASREQWQQNCTRTEERIAELESEMKVWESAATKHLARTEEVEQRIAELSEMEAHNECLIKKNADLTQQNIKLGERLATPVDINLPEQRDDSYDWDGASPSEAFNTCRSICGLMFRQQLRAVGVKVEGDEQ